MWIGWTIVSACSAPSPEPVAAPEAAPIPEVQPLGEARAAAATGDWARAVQLYDRRCEAARARGRDDDVACRLADQARWVEGGRRDCANGTVEACRRLCTEIGEGCASVVDAAARGCADGSGTSCKAWALALERTDAPHDEVNRILWRGCDESEPVDAWSCWLLADRVERGEGILPDAARGDVAWLRNQACDLQLAFACGPHPTR